ncbi:MAG: hypothetical protein WKG01_12875 [Kofleriaceae bacterium]
MKSLALALLLVPVPSLANPAPQLPMKFTLSVQQGAATRTHQLLLLDQSCGSVSEKSASHEDMIDVCADLVQGEIRLRVTWAVRQGPSEYKTKWESLVARKGLVEVGRVGGTRLKLEVQ